MVEVSLDLTGKIAVVTGASRRQGIGARSAVPWRRTAPTSSSRIGAHSIEPSHGADEDGPAALAHEFGELGVRAVGFEVDLADPAAPGRVLDEATARLGLPSILVNNAAHHTPGGYETLDAAALDAHHAVNVRAMALLSVEFARRYPGGPGGRIINLSSGQSVGPMPGELAYVATKGAVEAFTRTLAAKSPRRGSPSTRSTPAAPTRAGCPTS